jgi:UPF0716 protein FxsA
MRRTALAPVGLLLTAAAEITVFVLVAHAVGAGWAVLIMAGCCLGGLVLLRREGIRGWRRFRAAADAGRPPGPQVTDGLVGLLGALLLAVPGFVTAVLGVLLLVPPLRGVARRAVERSMGRRVSTAAAGEMFGPRQVRVHRGAPLPDQDSAPADAAAGPGFDGEIVEGEVVDAHPRPER